MSIKDLRISIGLTQKECADYLGMSLRNYQNYESNEGKSNTVRYNDIVRKLEAYPKNGVHTAGYSNNNSFNTNVVTGEQLLRFYEKVSTYEKRDCYRILKNYVEGSYAGKICILYGLRRTGKTTMLFQLLGELPVEKTAYIKVRNSDNMSMLTKDIDLLNGNGYEYILIDEITLLEDFINTASVLSDIYSMMGLKIILSGTDSLGFAMADKDELYDRNIMVHTSYIPFKEYSRLLKINSIDKYIEYGGTLKKENMGFDDPDSNFDEVSFKDDESTRKYIDTAISRNIQHTLKNDKYGEYFNQLRELYEKGELTNVINRIVESMNHRFVLSVVENEFKSHDLGSSKQLLLHEAPSERAHVLYNIDEREVVERLKKIIEIKEKKETKIKLEHGHIEQIKKYLVMLDLVYNCPDVLEGGGLDEHYIIAQPGMRYAIAKALVYSLIQDSYFQSISESDKTYIVEKILEDVKGRMLEDIVLLEVNRSGKKDINVFKYKFDNGGEFDMVIYNKQKNSCELFEIKHSDKVVDNQTRYLEDNECCSSIENIYGKIEGKYVLYRGKDTIVGDVKYLNVEGYLGRM